MSDLKDPKFALDDDDSDEDDVDYVPGAAEESDVSNSESECSDEDGGEGRSVRKRKASDEEEQSSSNKVTKTGDIELTVEEEEKRKQELWQRLNSANGKSADSSNVNETTKDTKKADQETKKAISTSIPSRASLPVRKASGVSNLLAKLGKKKESTLARSKSDWDQFKRQEGIEEELTEHTKSKGSYVDKQEFLQRADHRQFEQEKSVRDKVRSRMLP